MILGGVMNSKKDWHSADIIAALKKKGTSLSALSRQSGYAPSTLTNALVRPWTKGELIIASVLGIEQNHSRHCSTVTATATQATPLF